MTTIDRSRSATMRAVKSKDTKPELFVRSLIYRLGYRFRLHRKDIPGKPDIVFTGRKKVIFVHGCFWHGHTCTRGARVPIHNREYWIEKIGRNVSRHAKQMDDLKAAGWQPLVLWECELKDPLLSGRICAFLGPI